jgi:hypothetical protein
MHASKACSEHNLKKLWVVYELCTFCCCKEKTIFEVEL